MEHGNGLPEGTPVVAKELLHLGSRAAVDQALSRLVRRGTLMRAGRGIYVRPVESRFGAPLLEIYGSTETGQIATRRTIVQLETIAEEARRERSSRLTDDPDPDPIVRTSLRLRNDLIMLARAAIEPLPAAVGERLARLRSSRALRRVGRVAIAWSMS